MTKPTAAANAAGLPDAVCTYDWGDIRLPPFVADDDFEMAVALYEALRILNDVAAGLLCQPRFSLQNDCALNAAGRCLESLQQAIAFSSDDIAAQASAKAVSGPSSYSALRLALQDAAHEFENFDEIIAIVRTAN